MTLEPIGCLVSPEGEVWIAAADWDRYIGQALAAAFTGANLTFRVRNEGTVRFPVVVRRGA